MACNWSMCVSFYIGYVLDESSTDDAECCRKVVAAIRYLVNARSLQLKYARVLHEALLILFFCMVVRQSVEGGEV